MWNIFKLSLIIFAAQVAFAQAPTEKQDQYNRFKTKIINGGFENGTSQWSASGGTLTANTTLSNVRSGLRSGSWDATAASQTLTSAANTLSAGNNQVSCWFKTTATDYTFGAYDGTNVLVSQAIPATSDFQKITLNYAMSAAGQLRARITSASNAAIIYVDDCFAGEADNVGSGSVATDRITYTPATNVTTNTTTSGIYSRIGDKFEGDLQIDWSGAPSAFSVLDMDLPSGLTIDTSKILSSSANKVPLCWGKLHDNAGGTTPYNVEGWYSDSNTIRFKFLNDVGSLAYYSDISNTSPFSIASGSYLSVHCSAIPISGWGSASVWDANVNPAYWSGYHGSDCLWSSTSSTYADVSAGDASCTFTEVVNNNFGTVTSYQISSNNAPGIVFTPRRAGVYEVCAESSGFGPASTGQRQGKRLYDDTNVIGQTEYQTVGTTQDVFSHKICGFVNAADLSSKTYKLQPLTASGTITLGAPSGSSLAAVYWTIKQLSAVATAPLLTGNVTTGSTTRTEKLDSANVIGSAGTISSQSSSWVTVGRTSAGIYPITFASGYYSGDPRCTVSLADNTNGFVRFLGLPSNTGGSIVITNVADSANVDRNYTFQCMGPK